MPLLHACPSVWNNVVPVAPSPAEALLLPASVLQGSAQGPSCLPALPDILTGRVFASLVVSAPSPFTVTFCQVILDIVYTSVT